MRTNRQSWSIIVAVVAGLAGAPATARAQTVEADYAKVHFQTDRLASNVFTLTGSPGVDPGHPDAAGGRVGFLAGPEGVLVVDASYLPLGEKVVTAIRRVCPEPIRFLVDTHEHPDHTGGNPFLARLGALIFAREETREALTQPLPSIVGRAASGTDPFRLPVVTYGLGAPLKIRLNGEIVDLIPMPSSHTNGDTIVRFEHADVIMLGDFYRSYGYPFADLTHGGTFTGIVQAVDQVIQLAGPDTKLVPGHGVVVHRGDLTPYRDMIVDVMATVEQLVAEGKSLQDVLAAKVTAPYDAIVPGALVPLPILGTSADEFVSGVYKQLTTSP